MFRIFTSIAVLLFISTKLSAQPAVRQPDAGGSYTDLIQIKDDISPEQRARIVARLKANETRLRNEGKLASPLNTTTTAFQWPLKQAPGYNDNGYYGISNYVDENPAYPNLVKDYNCGNRSYDQPSGYNHAGTDIFTWPYSWQKMARNAVQIIAAAPGTIVDKGDGETDQNCAFCSSACSWNAVYVMHADGSVAWYGHMKSGSLTTKTIGQTVVAGEYLGVVGSSGNSTGPHLHFEVYTNSSYTQLVDPWGGACNLLGGTSWWANQQPYYVPTLNKIMMHGAAPSNNSCPAGEVVNEKINFANSDIIYCGSYYRDQQPGQSAVHTVYKPDNSIFSTWTQNFTDYYPASWWYYSLGLGSPAPTGTWRYEIVYNGTQKQTTTFAVNAASVNICANNYNVITSNLTGSTYQWQVNTGSGFVNISNGTNYANATTKVLTLQNVPTSFYGYQYRCFVNSASYSNIISLKFVSYWNGLANKVWENPSNWTCGNIPDANTDVVIQSTTNTPEVNSNVVCRSLTAPTGTNVKVLTGFKLDILK